MRKWVCFPIAGVHSARAEREAIQKIQERQDCIEDLINNYDAVEDFKRVTSKLCDVERLLTQIYTYSVKSMA